jgi:hypothetical protein
MAGVVFTLIGIGFLLDSLGAWSVDLVYLWPVILIGIGVSFLLGRAKRMRIEEDRSARLAVAEERVRIARELHDIVAHGVSLMTIQIAAARRVAATKPEAADEALANAEQAGRQSLAELRSLLAVLRSADASLGEVSRDPDAADWYEQSPEREAAPTAPQPRLSDIPALVDTLRDAGLDASLEQTGEVPSRVAPSIELAAYRIVQESLTNVVRHAPGARVVVDLDYAPDGIDIVVDALRPRAAPSKPGRERPAQAGACTHDSRSGRAAPTRGRRRRQIHGPAPSRRRRGARPFWFQADPQRRGRLRSGG